MTRSIYILSFLVWILPVIISGQPNNLVNTYPEVTHPEWFKVIPEVTSETPEWARLMYRDCMSFDKVVKEYEDYYSKNAFVKNIHTQNYRHWLKEVQNYVGFDGIIRKPKASEIFQSQQQNQLKNRAYKSSTNSWNVVGPVDTYSNSNSIQKQLNQVNIYSLAVATSNTSVLYASPETGGIFKTVDKGLNWFPVTFDYAIGNCRDIKIDPLDENIVYAANGNALFKTIDGGINWNLEYSSSGTLEQLWIHNTNTDTLLAATQDGVLRSTDGGANWTSVLSGYFYDIESKADDDNTLFVALKNINTQRPEIYKSTDGGTSWALKDTGFYSPTDLANATVYGCKIGVTPADPNRIYAGIIANGKMGDQGWIGVYYSNDAGETWQDDSGVDGGPYVAGNDPTTNWYVAGYSSGYHQGWYNYDLDVSHNDENKFWIGTIWFCESENKGGNFEYIRGTRSLPMHADIQDIDVIGDEIWIASDGGINYSNDECQTMEVRIKGITASHMWGFDHGWNDDLWVGGRYHNGDVVYRDNYMNGNTIFLGGAEQATGYVNQLDNKKCHFGDITDKVVSDTIGQLSENISNLGLYPTQSYFHFNYSEVEWHPTYANQVYLGNGNSLYKSTDHGANFDTLYTFNQAIKRFEISREDPNYIYAIIHKSSSEHGVFKSIDGGKSFAEVVVPPYNGGNWKNLSITLNPFDKEEIWMASNSSSNGNKIFSSVDGGQSWTNRYSPIIENEPIKDLVYHASPSGNIVYVMTDNNFFYYDIYANEWIQYNTGLPILHGGFKMLPFYKKEKIRMAGNKGVWEVDMLRSSSVQVLPYANYDTIYCERDTVSFECHSIVNHNAASWQWSFSPSPAWISNTTVRNPLVAFGNPGSYDVTLTITQGGSTFSKTIQDFVTVQEKCAPEPLAGNTFSANSDSDFMVANEANLENITHFTATGWWKPNGMAKPFSALFSSGDWCAHCDYTEALMVNYHGGKVWYKWPGSASWGSNSGMSIPEDEWSYVAMVVKPSGVTLYINEQKYENNTPLQPGNFNNIHIGRGHYSKSFNGEIDEVTLWKRALTEDEIRKLRHITKENQIQSDPDLIAYYQFNEDINTTQIFDRAGVNHGVLKGNAILKESTAPVGGGTSDLKQVNASGVVDFVGTGASINFPSSGPFPNGDVVVSRINNEPDSIPNSSTHANTYWIINNYGTNNTFNQVINIKLDEEGNNPSYSYSDVSLVRRNANEHLNNWTISDNEGDQIDASNGTITFDSGLMLTSDGQFTFDNNPNAFNGIMWIGVEDTDWNNPNNWDSGTVPIQTDDVVIPAGVPYYPVVDENVLIHTLFVQQGATIHVLTGVMFEVESDND